MTLQLTFKPPQGYSLTNFNLFLEFFAKFDVSINKSLSSITMVFYVLFLLFFFRLNVTYKFRPHCYSNRCKCHRISVAVKYSSMLISNWFNAPVSIVHSFYGKLNRIFIIQLFLRTAPTSETMKWRRFVKSYETIRHTWASIMRRSFIGIECHRMISYWMLICTLTKWPADITPHFGNGSVKCGFIICRYF